MILNLAIPNLVKSITSFTQKTKINLLKTSVTLPICFFLILFSCQKDEFPGRATLSLSGGSLTSLDGKIKLNIPANSISASTLIRITEGYEELFTLLNGTTIGKVYDLEPYGMKFSNPVNVEINYRDLSKITNPENLGAVHLGRADDKFINNISVNNDLTNKTLTFHIDHFSQLKIVEFQGKCATFKFFWSIPVLKWFLEIPVTASYLNESNIKSALALWAEETSSFIFEQTYDKSAANMIFTDVHNIDGFKEFESTLHIHDEAGGMVCFDFGLPDLSDVILKEKDHINIYIASEAFNTNNEEENISKARKVLAQEIGHALGIAHTVQSTSPDPVMSGSVNSSSSWDGKLHQWDINALHEKYALKQNISCAMKLDTLVNYLEYPFALFLSNNKLYYTETAYFNASGGKLTLNFYDLVTKQNTLLKYQPLNYDAMVVIGDKIYLSSWSHSIPGESGRVSIFDITKKIETDFLSVGVATQDMCLDSHENFYLLGTSDLPAGKSLYKFPVSDYSRPLVLMTGLGRTLSIVSKDDDIYYSDHNSIWKIGSSLSRTIFYQKSFIFGMAISDTYMYFSDYFNNKIGRINMQSKVAEVLFSNIPYPGKMVFDRENKILYVLSHGTVLNKFKDGKILKITSIE